MLFGIHENPFICIIINKSVRDIIHFSKKKQIAFSNFFSLENINVFKFLNIALKKVFLLTCFIFPNCYPKSFFVPKDSKSDMSKLPLSVSCCIQS